VSFFVDGIQVSSSTDTDPSSLAPVATLRLSAVAEIQVWRGPSEVPVQYARPGVNCGAVAITTRR
jgi:hypothetical protein